MRTIYVATTNPGKLRDFNTAARVHDAQVLPIVAVGNVAPPEETGHTFEENASIKAEAYSRQLPGELVIADDSGLSVVSLGGEPGVRSARYAADAGIQSDDADAANNALLLERIQSVPDDQRDAAFICAIAVARDGVTLATFVGEVRGRVLRELRGSGGFGYDPLFFFPPFGKSFGEISPEQKLSVSHRGEAFQKFLLWLDALEPTATAPAVGS